MSLCHAAEHVKGLLHFFTNRLSMEPMARKTDVDALLKERLRELGAKGGKKAAKGLSKPERVEKAKKAAAARWGRKKRAPGHEVE